MHILGINAAFHDSSACLVRDGVVIAAAEEERFSQIKHGKRATPYQAHALPFQAIGYCLEAGGITLADVDDVAYSFDPFLLTHGTTDRRFALPRDVDEARQVAGYDPWDTIFLAGVTAAPRMLRDDVPFHLRERLNGDASRHRWRFHFVEHHLAHAASAYYPAPFDRAAVLTLDGRGECVSTFLGVGDGLQLEKLNEVALPHSLGLLYERVTTHLGFLNYHRLLERFQAKTGVPIVVNTSFNTRGKPIVCTPRDALECFFTSPLDTLAIGSYVVQK